MAPLAEAFVRVRADTSNVREDVRRDFTRAGGDAGNAFGAQFSRDAQGRLRDERGRFVNEGHKLGESTGGGFNTGFDGKLRGSGGLGDIAGKVFDLLTPRLSGLAGGFGAAAASVGGLIGNLGQLAVAAGAVSTLAAGTAAAATSMVSLVAALAPAAGAIAALPGAVAGVIAVNGVLKLSFYAVSDAMQAAYDNDAKAFEKAFEKLTPAAKNFAVEFRNVVPAMKEFQRAAQDGFFGELNGRLGGFLALLTSTQPAITSLAAETGKWAGQLAVFATAEKSVDQFNSILGNTKQTLQGLREALQPLLTGFLDLSVVGTEFFQRLSGDIATAGTRFGMWLSEISQSGKALEWMNNAVQVFKALGSIAADVGGILRSVFKAAETAGTGALGIIGQLADKLNTFLGSTKGQAILVAVFENLYRVGQALTPVIESLAGALALIAPKVADVAVSFSRVLVAAIGALGPAVAALAPGLIAVGDSLARAFASEAVRNGLLALGQGIANLLVAASPLIPIVLNLALTLLNALVPAVAALAPGLVAVGNALVKAFNDPAVAAALLSLGTGLANLLIAVSPLIGPLVELAAILVDRLGNNLTLLATFLQPVISALSDILMPILPELASLFRDISAALLPVAEQLGGELASALRDASTFLAPLKDALREVGTEILGALREVLPQITPHLGELARSFAAIFVELAKLLPDLIKFAGEILVALIQQLPVLAPMAVRLADAFLEIVKQVGPLIPPLLKLLLQIVLPLIPELPKLLPPLIDLAWIFADLFAKYAPLLMKFLESPEALAAVKDLAANGALALNTLARALELVVGLAQLVIGSFFGMPDQIGAGLSRMGTAIKGWINDVIGWVESLMNAFAGVVPGLPRVSLPRLADGAIIHRATIAMIGEAGPEVVIPLGNKPRALQLAQESGLLDVLASQMRGLAAPFAVRPLATPALAGASAYGAFDGGGRGRGDRHLTVENVWVQDGNMAKFWSDLHVDSLGEWG